MSLEGRDINDNSILDATKSDLNNGAMKLSIVLPSGRTVESEWFREDKKSEALRAWVETIRQEIVFDAEEVRAQMRRRIQEEDAARKRAAAGIIVGEETQTIRGIPAGTVLASPTGALPAEQASYVPASDPVAFAQAEYNRALLDIERLADAEQRALRWRQALEAFGVVRAAKPKKRRRKKAAAKGTAARGELVIG